MTFNRRKCGVITTPTGLILTKCKCNATCQIAASLCQNLFSSSSVKNLQPDKDVNPERLLYCVQQRPAKICLIRILPYLHVHLFPGAYQFHQAKAFRSRRYVHTPCSWCRVLYVIRMNQVISNEILVYNHILRALLLWR